MDEAQFITHPLLQGQASLRHGFFTRNGGISTGIYQSLNSGLGSDDVRQNVIENRVRIARAMDVDADKLLSPYQVHSPDVAVLDEALDLQEKPRVDAFVTRLKNIGLGINTADCGPVLFADIAAGVIGAAHAGWRGAFSGVLENTISSMESLGANRGDIIAVLGPCIGPKNYEVGPEFMTEFLNQNSKHESFFSAHQENGHAFFDLPQYILDRLNQAGIGQAAWIGVCTYEDEARFFSNRRRNHRGEPDYGRQLSVISQR